MDKQEKAASPLESRPSKIFRDNVHGYISIPTDYVKSFIDTELFQRLRNIEQTGMRVLYPSARHDRFIHSLGVYHLGRKAFLCFKANVKRHYGDDDGDDVKAKVKRRPRDNHYKVFRDSEENERFWNRCQMLFEIACLLHDCGHAPFSHTLEYLYDVEQPSGENLRQKLKNYFSSPRFEKDFQNDGPPHERMSALMVATEYRREIDALLSKYGLDEVERDENPTELIARMIIGCLYSEPSPSCQIKNCLISLLNSTSIDVDSLDYIVRDAAMSGIDNMSIDVDRLLSSLTLVELTSFHEEDFHDVSVNAVIVSGMKRNGVRRIENPKLTPLSGSQDCSFSGKLAGVLDAEGPCSAQMEGTIELSGNFKAMNQPKLRNARRLQKSIIMGTAKLRELPNIETPSDFTLTGALDSPLKAEGSSLHFRSRTDVRIHTLNAKSLNFGQAYIEGRLTGRFSGTLLGNHARISGGTVELCLGFHKSSLSVIQNVVIARNYEYQWVYSHHKVVYYANYLLIELLRTGVRFLLEKENQDPDKPIHATDYIASFLSWKSMIDPAKQGEAGCGPQPALGSYFWRSTDADILALFKRCQIEAKAFLKSSSAAGNGSNAAKFTDLMRQYTMREYRKSLWKSYAEMCNFLSEFTEDEISKLLWLLINQATSQSLALDTNSMRLKEKYGYLNEEWKRKFHDCGMDNVVWVSGDSKMKSIDPNQTFIHFEDRDMNYGSVSSLSSVTPEQNFELFYLYYQPVPGIEIEEQKSNLTNFLRQKLEELKQSE